MVMAEEKKVSITVNEGVKHICGWVRFSTWLRLQEIKARTGKSESRLIEEAIEMVYGIKEGQEGGSNGQQA
jgi:hypothetical protein